MKLDKEQFSELVSTIVKINREFIDPLVIEEARRTAEGLTKQIIYSEMKDEIEAAIRRVVREKVHAEVRVVLKEGE